MSAIYLIRHGKSKRNWSVDPDSPLGKLGRQQSLVWANKMASIMDPIPIYSSPKLRTMQTAGFLAKIWGINVEMHQSLEEIPIPTEISMAQRSSWLEAFTRKSWSMQSDIHLNWEKHFLSFLRTFESDVVIVSHYLNINRAIAVSKNSLNTICMELDHCSATVMTLYGNKLSFLEYWSNIGPNEFP